MQLHVGTICDEDVPLGAVFGEHQVPNRAVLQRLYYADFLVSSVGIGKP
jgi:hypothetical protein